MEIVAVRTEGWMWR